MKNGIKRWVASLKRNNSFYNLNVYNIWSDKRVTFDGRNLIKKVG
jgi:hypothetical protein